MKNKEKIVDLVYAVYNIGGRVKYADEDGTILDIRLGVDELLRKMPENILIKK